MTKKKEPSHVYVHVQKKCARCGGGFGTFHMRPPKDEAERERWLAEADVPSLCPFCSRFHGDFLHVNEERTAS